MNKHFAEVAGWTGAIAIILAYALVSFDVVESDSYTFQLLNLFGALGIIIISAVKGVKQSVFLNIFWGIIALVALIKIILD